MRITIDKSKNKFPNAEEAAKKTRDSRRRLAENPSSFYEFILENIKLGINQYIRNGTFTYKYRMHKRNCVNYKHFEYFVVKPLSELGYNVEYNEIDSAIKGSVVVDIKVEW